MYNAKTLAEPTDPAVLRLSQSARTGTLSICAGAGISSPPPANLPSAQLVAETLFDRLAPRVSDPPTELRSKLDKFADWVEGIDGDVTILQNESIAAFDLDGAAFNFAHEVLALLCIEGAVRLFVTNWDNCIERAVPEGLRLNAVVTSQENMDTDGPVLFKVHGCVTQPHSLLMSTSQLESPPIWVESEIGGALNRGEFVFIGIGSVADHTKRRLRELVAAVSGLDRISVVSPSVIVKWEDSVWDELTHELPDRNRIPKEGDEFLDDLLRGYLTDFFASIAAAASDQPGDSVSNTLADLQAAVYERDGITLASWLRRGAFEWRAGRGAMSSPRVETCVLGAARFVLDASDVAFSSTARLCIDGRIVELLYSERPSNASALRQRGIAMTERDRAKGKISPDAPVVYVCDGPLTPFPSTTNLESNIVDVSDSFDIIDGPSALQPEFVSATDQWRILDE